MLSTRSPSQVFHAINGVAAEYEVPNNRKCVRKGSLAVIIIEPSLKANVSDLNARTDYEI
jgi:hypothetical protein